MTILGLTGPQLVAICVLGLLFFLFLARLGRL